MDQGPLITRMKLVRYQALLEKETDEKKREMLQRLIAELKAELPRAGRLSLCWRWSGPCAFLGRRADDRTLLETP